MGRYLLLWLLGFRSRSGTDLAVWRFALVNKRRLETAGLGRPDALRSRLVRPPSQLAT